MKLQIAYNLLDIDQALDLAEKTASFADSLVIGPLLLFKKGVEAISMFRTRFPKHELIADAKICDRAQESITLFAQAGANVITVLAGTSNDTIFNATQTAHRHKSKICLDLLDAYSMGESAHDAESLGVDVITFHRSHDSTQIVSILDEWDTTRGNTRVPIHIAGNINRNNVERVLALKPDGIIIGRGIVQASNPESEAAYFKSLIS